MGAYMTYAGARLATYNFSRCFPTVYRVPHIDASVRCVFTHSTPTGPYRGAGRPEANYLMERLVEEAARVTGIDRVALRKRNFIPRSAMPYKTDVQTTYDSGEFPAVFEKALTLADYAGFKKRKREAARRGKYRGFGISCFLEHSGGVPTEGALLEFPGGEKLVIALGVQSTGQGHATVYPRLVAEKLGILPSQVIAPPRRFFVGDKRRPGGRLALDHHGGHRDRPRRRDDARQSESASRRRRWKPPRATSSIAAGCSKWSAPTG